jgi:predicted ester cyclase
MAVDIKQSSRRVAEEVYGQGKLEVADEIADRGLRVHDPLEGDMGLEQVKESVRMFRSAFPDLDCSVLAQYVDGDCCITRWRATGTHRGAFMGIEPTGVKGTVEGITIDRYRGGKLVECWTQFDALGLFRQMGASTGLQTGAPQQQGGRAEPRHHA